MPSTFIHYDYYTCLLCIVPIMYCTPQGITVSVLQSLVRTRKTRQTALTAADDDEMTLDLSMVQIGRLVSDAAFNLEVCWGSEDLCL